jgi:diguanylate cyclase (GGDEF)-like protein
MDTGLPHVLIVEDNASTRQALAAILDDEGYRVSQAEGGLQAIEIASQDPPDIVLSDVSMPSGDGFFLVQELRKLDETRHVPIVLLSALDDTKRRVTGLDLGADDYLPKPVDADELLARMRAHLRHFQRQTELMLGCVTDPSTGLLNRRGLEEALERELARWQRGSKLALLMADMDGFKEINDRHGHAAGDYVLRHVARCLSDTARTIDHAGRLGGDEFLVILSGCDEQGARQAAQRLTERIEQPLLLPNGITIQPRVSIGYYSSAEARSAEEWLDGADGAMYDLKRKRHGSLSQHARPTPRQGLPH